MTTEDDSPVDGRQDVDPTTRPDPTPEDWNRHYLRIEQGLGAHIREIRTGRDMSQQDLAHEMTLRGFPMHQTTVAKMESGKRPLRVAEAFAVAHVFWLPTPYFLMQGFLGSKTADESDILREISETEARANRFYERVSLSAADYAHRYLEEVRRLGTLNEQLQRVRAKDGPQP